MGMKMRQQGSRRLQPVRDARRRRSGLKRLLALSSAAAATLQLSSARHAFATTGPDTWLGNSSVSFGTVGNWNPATNNLPANGDSLFFGAAGSFGTTLSDNLMTPGNYTLTGITFNSGAASFTINPQTSGTNGFTLSGSITNNAANTETINDLITLASGNQTVNTASGSIFFGGAVGGSGALIKTGNNTFAMQQASTYSGGTIISSGVLGVGLNGSTDIGNGQVTWNGSLINPLGNGTIVVAAGASLELNPNNMSLSNNIVLNGVSYGTGTNNGHTATNTGVFDGALMGGSQNGSTTTLSGTITLNADSNFSTSWDDKILKLTGQVTGVGGLIVDPVGTGRNGTVLQLGNSTNNYQGNTTISAKGTASSSPRLQTLATNVIPSGASAGNVYVYGTLDLNSFSQSINGLNGNGSVTSLGSGGTPTFTVGNNNANGNFSGVIQNGNGTVALTKVGSGTLTLNASSSYSGGTVINQGVVAASNIAFSGSNSSIGTGGVTLNGGTLRATNGFNGAFDRTITINAGGGTLDTNVNFFALGSGLTGSGPLTFLDSSGNGTQFLVVGSNTAYSGNVTVGNGSAGSGSLQYRSSSANPFGTGTIQINGGGVVTADPNGNTTPPSTLGNNFILSGGGLGTQTPNMTYTGTISLAPGTSSSLGNPIAGYIGTVTFTNVIGGGSTAGLNINSASSVTLSGNSTYAGATTVSAGTLTAGVASIISSGNATSGAFGVKSAVSLGNVSGATLNLNNFNQQIGSLAGGGSVGGNVTLGNATLTTGEDGTSTAYRGAISGTGGLTKIGSGTLSLTSSSNYTGGTNVSAGILAVGLNNSGIGGGTSVYSGSPTNPLGNGTIAIAAGASLQINPGSTTYSNNIVLNGLSYGGGSGMGHAATNNGLWDGAIMAGSDAVTLTTTFSGTITLNATSNLSTDYSDKTLLITGNITGVGGLTIDPAGTGRNGSLVKLSGTNNTYQGDTTVDPKGAASTAPTLQAGAANVIPGGAGKGNVNVYGTLDINSFTQSINGLNGNGTVTSTGASSGNRTALSVENNNASSTFSGVINNFITLNVAANGTLDLAGTADNSDLIAAVASGGTLILDKQNTGSNPHALGNSGTGTYALTINSGGTARLGTFADTVQIYNQGTDGGVNNNGIFDLNGQSFTINNIAGNGTITNGNATAATLTVGLTAGTDSTYAGVIQNGNGTVSLSKGLATTLTLTGNNSYTGNTTISAGAIQLGSGGTSGNLSGSSAIIDNAALIFNRSNTITQGTDFGSISGSGSVTQAGGGTTTLSSGNTYTGITTISAGTLSISSESGLGSNPGSFNAAQLTLNGGTLQTTGNFTVSSGNRGVTIGANGGTFVVNSGTGMNIVTPITGSGNITVSGAGILTIGNSTGSGGSAVSTANNTFTGKYIINNGANSGYYR